MTQSITLSNAIAKSNKRTRLKTGTNNSRIKTLFLPGFIIGFILTGALVCGGLGMILGLDEISLADIRNNEEGWSPPEITPTPESVLLEDAFAPAESPAGTFSTGELAFNVTDSRVNIRSSPGHLGKPGEDIYALAQPGDPMEILGGPEYADSLAWWLIRYTASDGTITDGWVAEATSNGVTILGN